MFNTGRFLWNARKVYSTSEQERQAGRFWSGYMKQASSLPNDKAGQVRKGETL